MAYLSSAGTIHGRRADQVRIYDPEGSISTPHKVEKVQILHELGGDLTSNDVHVDRWVKPSTVWTQVRVSSRVESHVAQRMTSPHYLATIRRRESQKLCELLSSLAEHENREDFSVATHPVVEGIRKLLLKLIDAENEGNTREILRRLRDTFLDGGWNKYRATEARALAMSIVRRLAQTEEITAEDAREVFDLLYNAGLRPVACPILDVGCEGDDIDDEDCEVPS